MQVLRAVVLLFSGRTVDCVPMYVNRSCRGKQRVISFEPTPFDYDISGYYRYRRVLSVGRIVNSGRDLMKQGRRTRRKVLPIIT